jgi:LacI family transcriptional regulator
VPLSSVRQPRHQLGRTAAQLLLEEALGGASHQHRQVVFEPELVIRQSSLARRQDRPRKAPRAKPEAATATTATAPAATAPAATAPAAAPAAVEPAAVSEAAG